MKQPLAANATGGTDHFNFVKILPSPNEHSMQIANSRLFPGHFSLGQRARFVVFLLNFASGQLKDLNFSNGRLENFPPGNGKSVLKLMATVLINKNYFGTA
jgi:hypothetical protein